MASDDLTPSQLSALEIEHWKQRAWDAEAREYAAIEEARRARLLIERFARIDVRTLSMAQFTALQGEFRAFMALEMSNGR